MLIVFAAIAFNLNIFLQPHQPYYNQKSTITTQNTVEVTNNNINPRGVIDINTAWYSFNKQYINDDCNIYPEIFDLPKLNAKLETQLLFCKSFPNNNEFFIKNNSLFINRPNSDIPDIELVRIYPLKTNQTAEYFLKDLIANLSDPYEREHCVVKKLLDPSSAPMNNYYHVGLDKTYQNKIDTQSKTETDNMFSNYPNSLCGGLYSQSYFKYFVQRGDYLIFFTEDGPESLIDYEVTSVSKN